MACAARSGRVRRIATSLDAAADLHIPPASRGCSSAWLECRTVTAEVAGSSPVSPVPSVERATPSPRTGCFVFRCRTPDMTEPARPAFTFPFCSPRCSRPPRARAAWWTPPWATAATPRRSGAAGAEVLGIDRDPAAIARAAGRLGDAGIRYLQAAVRLDPRRWPRSRAFASRLHPARSGRVVPPIGRGWSAVLLSVRARRSTCAWAATARRPPTLLNEADEAELGAALRRVRRRAPGAAPRPGDRAPARAASRSPVSDDLVNAIRAVLGPRAGPPDFARLFQAVRIAVNDELGGLDARAARRSATRSSRAGGWPSSPIIPARIGW